MDFNNNFIGYPGQQQQQMQVMPQIPYKPVTFEKLSNFVGGAYNLSSLENLNTVTAPRGSEQQILFVNNDDKIYTRGFDNSMGIIGYKQAYVENLQKELEEAQNQLHQIFEEITKQVPVDTEQEPVDTTRLDNLEKQLEELKQLIIGGKEDESKGNNEPVAKLSKMA